MLSNPASSTTLANPTTSWTVISPATKDSPPPNITYSKITVPRETLPKKSFEALLSPFPKSTLLSGTVSSSNSRRKRIKTSANRLYTKEIPVASQSSQQGPNWWTVQEGSGSVYCRAGIRDGLPAPKDTEATAGLRKNWRKKSLQPNQL